MFEYQSVVFQKSSWNKPRETNICWCLIFSFDVTSTWTSICWFSQWCIHHVRNVEPEITWGQQATGRISSDSMWLFPGKIPIEVMEFAGVWIPWFFRFHGITEQIPGWWVWLPSILFFPFILGLCHHPNWRTHIFQRGFSPTTNQNQILPSKKNHWWKPPDLPMRSCKDTFGQHLLPWLDNLTW